jgi:methionyl-tRNA formyltransferase
MRVAFLGNDRWSVPSIESLAASRHDVAVVVTRTPRPAGRGSRLLPTPVAGAAGQLGLPVREVETVKTGGGLEVLEEAAPDIVAVVAYGEILPPAVLAIPRVAPVNVHFSLLPRLRGAAPVQRAILTGLPVTGVTTIRMDEGMDTGPILLQAEETITPEDDAGSLGARLADLGGRLLIQTIDGLEAGTVVERSQDEAGATYAPKLKPEERIIDWSLSAAEIVRLVRAMAPEPAASTRFRDGTLRVLRAAENGVRLMNDPAEHPPSPGAIFQAGKDGLIVAAGTGFVRLDEVQPEGRRHMSGAEFVRGYRPQVGQILG